MAKNTHYSCQNCGHGSAQWLGRCPSCSSWNSFVEEPAGDSREARRGTMSGAAISRVKKKGGAGEESGPRKIHELEAGKECRWGTGLRELDRVLGGGMVEASFVLLAGDPGIGKSTLLLQSLERMAASRCVLYITGEESAEQVKLRAQRLGVEGQSLYLAAETNWEKVLGMIEELGPKVVAIDSIQTMYTDDVMSAPGSVAQVREVGARLMHVAKRAGVVVILVGHVTKDGSIAGPRVLEHMVDTVLQFESVGGNSFRILRAIKNRFGSTSEVGIFEMQDSGLVEVKNPSELFLAERPKGSPGSVVVSSMEGTRPLMVELQALVSRSVLGTPRRTVLGVDTLRAAILLAVLEKRVGLEIYDRDVFLNVVGGIQLREPSADLGVIAALASSFHNVAIESDVVFLGEVGLTGEVRSVSRADERIREAASLGFRKAFLPERNHAQLKGKVSGLELIPVRKVGELAEILFR